MKTLYKYIGLTVLTYLFFSASIFAKEEFTKNITKEYEANSNTTLEVINKYGQIQIENWEKQSIKIDITIKVEHNNMAEAEKLLNMITVEFSQSGNLIKAVTNFDEGFGTSKIWGNNRMGKKFSIDYTILLPKNINLKLMHKYGNIFINEITGLVEIDQKYGNLTINKLTRKDEKPLNTIVLSYGKATIDFCSWLKLNASYCSDASINTCKALLVVSKYSKIRVEKVSSIVAESAYDGYRIGSVSNFALKGKYSHYKMNSLSNKLDAEIKYGGINIEVIPSGFESINVESSYSGIKLGISPQASYKLDANTKYGNISYPKISNVNRISENNSVTVTGIIGEEKSKSTISINSSYGNIDLNQ